MSAELDTPLENDESDLLRALVERGCVVESEVDLAREAQLRDERKDVYRPIVDYLLDARCVTPAQVARAVRDVEDPDSGGDLPGYKLLETLGRGSMGTVHRGRQICLEREVAIKLLSRRLARNRHYVESFGRECQLAALAGGQFFPQVYDAGFARGQHFLVMEFVAGTSVGAKIASGPMSTAETLDVAIEVCAALDHLHRLGVVHRDVKPQNIVLGPHRRLKLLDLGLARRLDDALQLENERGAAIGTPHYISPEQVSGGKSLDGRSDLYSLGASMYHMLTGRRLFERDSTTDVFGAHMKDRPTPLRVHQPLVPPQVEAVVLRMLEKHPDQRYSSADALREQLLALREALQAVEATEHFDEPMGPSTTPAPSTLHLVGNPRQTPPPIGAMTLGNGPLSHASGMPATGVSTVVSLSNVSAHESEPPNSTTILGDGTIATSSSSISSLPSPTVPGRARPQDLNFPHHPAARGVASSQNDRLPPPLPPLPPIRPLHPRAAAAMATFPLAGEALRPSPEGIRLPPESNSEADVYPEAAGSSSRHPTPDPGSMVGVGQEDPTAHAPSSLLTPGMRSRFLVPEPTAPLDQALNLAGEAAPVDEAQPLDEVQPLDEALSLVSDAASIHSPFPALPSSPPPPPAPEAYEDLPSHSGSAGAEDLAQAFESVSLSALVEVEFADLPPANVATAESGSADKESSSIGVAGAGLQQSGSPAAGAEEGFTVTAYAEAGVEASPLDLEGLAGVEVDPAEHVLHPASPGAGEAFAHGGLLEGELPADPIAGAEFTPFLPPAGAGVHTAAGGGHLHAEAFDEASPAPASSGHGLPAGYGGIHDAPSSMAGVVVGEGDYEGENGYDGEVLAIEAGAPGPRHEHLPPVPPPIGPDSAAPRHGHDRDDAEDSIDSARPSNRPYFRRFPGSANQDE